MTTKLSLNQVDYSNESTRSTWHMPDFDEVSFTGLNVLAQALRTAIEAISLCNEKSLTGTLALHTASGTPPSSVYAQRELLLRVFYKDTVTGKQFSMTIPGPDLTLLSLAGDEVTLGVGAEVIAFVTAFEAAAVSEAGNTVTVTRIVVDGRHA